MHLTSYLSRNHGSKHPGFTLSEVLISLVIIGLLATFVIGKVLHNLEEAGYRTALKEAEAVIQSVAHEAYMEGYTGHRFNYYRSKVNTTKVCLHPHGVTQGCMVVPEGFSNAEYREGALVLPSGVTIGGINTHISNHWMFSGTDGWRIDLNGTKPPNVEGVDILRWRAPEFNASGQIHNCDGSRRLGCPDLNHAPSVARYNQLMGLQ